jgi:hypothetical protein
MHLNERKIEVGDVDRYTIIEKIDQIPYKIDLKTMKKFENRVGNHPIVRKLYKFSNSMTL